jgi:hypothetical protein
MTKREYLFEIYECSTMEELEELADPAILENLDDEIDPESEEGLNWMRVARRVCGKDKAIRNLMAQFSKQREMFEMAKNVPTTMELGDEDDFGYDPLGIRRMQKLIKAMKNREFIEIDEEVELPIDEDEGETPDDIIEPEPYVDPDEKE